MNNTNGQEYRSKLKKAISGVNQALTLHYALEGLSVRDYSTAEDLVNNLFKKRMNVIDVDDGTFPGDYTIKYHAVGFNCTPNSRNSFITQDGVIFCIYNFGNGSNYVGKEEYRKCNSFNTKPCTGGLGAPNLYIDVNAFKKPNRITINSSQPFDQYHAYIYNTLVKPSEMTKYVLSDIPDYEEFPFEIPGW